MNRFLAIFLTIIACIQYPLAASADLLINEFVTCNASGFTDEEGDFEDWIEIFNSGPTAVDLEGHGLSDNTADPMKWLFPAVTLEAGAHLLVVASGRDMVDAHIHCNFKINSGGETLVLSDETGAMLDVVYTGGLTVDIARGRCPDGGGWYLFAEPTPGNPNSTTAYLGICASPDIQPPAGHHASGVAIEMSQPDTGAEIFYSLDGTTPDGGSALYTQPVPIDTTTAVRARALLDSMIPSPVVTQTYLIDETTSLAVSSVTTDPANLWDDEIGIYTKGPNAEPDWPYLGANFWQDWERRASYELFLPSGERVLAQDVGLKIHGGSSRANAQKSFRVIAREAYGEDKLQCPIFDELPFDEYSALVLRNSGQGFRKAHLRDATVARITRGCDLDIMAYEPAIIFLNGVYWGMLNLRERLHENYFGNHYGVDEDIVIIMESYGWAKHGDPAPYTALSDFIETHDLSVPADYDYVATRMELLNFIEYNVFQIFFANTDWPASNRRYWRPGEPGGRFRWILQDLDKGLEYWARDLDLLDRATNPDPEVWGLPSWSTMELRRLLENPNFRRDFINAFADHLNSTFLPQHTLGHLSEVSAGISDEIVRHRTFWDQFWDFEDTWENEVYEVELFLEVRPDFAWANLLDFFDLEGTFDLELDVSPPGAGRIELTAIAVDDAWSGRYFNNHPVPLRAHPKSGYRFYGWSHPGLPANPDVMIQTDQDYTVTALFVEDAAGDNGVVINEINYNSADCFDCEDWIELHNRGDVDRDLSGWVVKDDSEGHVFTLPAGTTLPAGGYLVLCTELAAFQALFPQVTGAIGDLGFGLGGGGDQVRLFNDMGNPIDFVEYSDDPPWPPEPDGDGPTLELVCPHADNARPEFWNGSIAPHGTPGERNSTWDPVGVEEQAPPATTRLDRPWPNPFNPATHIAFTLAAGGPVRLDIFDVKGRRVDTLIDKTLPKGEHTTTWRADGLPSGVYHARLRTEEGIFSNKLILLK